MYLPSCTGSIELLLLKRCLWTLSHEPVETLEITVVKLN